MRGDHSEHGTPEKYRGGCRCEPCRDARYAYMQDYSERNRERIRERDRAYYERTREERLAYQQRWRAENREKKNAQSKLRRAVKSGRIVRPSTCEHCGVTGQIDAHHHDYAQPFLVSWLCEKCHRLVHVGRLHREAAGVGG